MSNSPMCFRWPDALARDVKMVADVDGAPVGTIICRALAEYVESRRADQSFRGRLRARIEKDQLLLSQLEGKSR